MSSLIVNQAFRACVHLNEFQRGKTIHQELPASLLNNQYIRTNLIRLYMNCNDVDKAREIFSTAPKKSIVMYNTMIEGDINCLGENNREKEALKLFEKMSVTPNAYTYSILFKLCTQLPDRDVFEFCKTVWKEISLDNQKNPVVSTSFLALLLKHQQISICEKFFSQIEKNNVTRITMMKGYLSHGMPQKAIDLFLQLDKPDEIAAGAFFNACAQIKDKKTLDLADKVFSRLRSPSDRLLQSVFNMHFQHADISKVKILFEKVQRNVINYASLMKLYNDQSQPEKTLKLFQRMKAEHVEGDSVVFVLLINACADIRFLSLSRSIVKQIPKNLLADHWLAKITCTYVGSVDEAQRVFNRIAQPMRMIGIKESSFNENDK
ncbi:unnamed protein product [Adineta ricciae]|uniref:Uncharacterized protein n=1 Tax=Adineta ricciae TaxID=249248 RepID=A0A814PPT7_ADIRI|nr:unnamed protein product [Adineta ricciae]